MYKIKGKQLAVASAFFLAANLHAGSFEGYVTDIDGSFVRTLVDKECVHSGFWNESLARPECSETLEARSQYNAAVENAQRYNQPAPQKPAIVQQWEEERTPQAEVQIGVPQVSNSFLTSITVRPGDNLWDIAENQQVYGDARLWPLLLCSNKDQIADSDLIYPGQILNVRHNIPYSTRQNAIIFANTRGEWRLGEVEDNDLEYKALNCY